MKRRVWQWTILSVLALALALPAASADNEMDELERLLRDATGQLTNQSMKALAGSVAHESHDCREA